MSDKKGDDKKAAKADKKGDDKKKADKPKADKADAKPKDDAKPKGGDDKKGADKKADKPKDKAPKEDKPKADDKPKAEAEAKDAAPAAAAAGDDKKGAGKGKGKEKKEKAESGDKKADGKDANAKDAKDAPVVEAQELSHADPNKPVEKPNKDQLDNDVKALEKVVKEIESTITRLAQQLEAKNQERARLRTSKNELFEEGKKIKEEREKKDVQVRALTTKIEEIIAERKNNRQRLDATAKSLRYTNLDELEKAITQTELRIATSSLSLAAEKQLIAELKLLKAQRVEVAKFAVEKQKVNTVNAAKTDELKAGDVREKRDELRKQATALFKLEKEAFEKFSAAKSKDNELKRECDALAEKRRTNLKDKKTFVDKIYAMKREFVAADRAYYKWLQRQKKDKASANRARAREERPSAGMEGAVGGSAPQQHQTAYVDTNRPAAGMGNRRAKKEKAAGAGAGDDKPRKKAVAGPDGDDDEPAIEEIEDLTDIVPYAAEKALCDKLVRYVTQLQGKYRSADDAKDEKAKDEKKADHVLVDDRNKGFKGKPATVLQSKKGKGSDKLEDFFGKDVSKSQDISAKPKKAAAAAVIDLKGGDAKVQVVQPTDKKAAARAAAKKQKLTHVPDVFTEFKALGLTAPVEVGQLEAALKALVEKKAYFESNPAADDVEAAAAAGGAAAAAGDAAEAPADGAALADKQMDEEKAARVKEAEELKAAAAKISADERKKAAKAADAAAEAERLRRVAEEAKAKKENADEENKERQRRKSLASEAEDAEQKRRVEEDAKAKSAADAEEAKTRATGRRNSLQAQDEEQKRRIAAGEDHHDRPSVVAQVDAAEKKNPKGAKKDKKQGKGKKNDDAKADAAKADDAKAAPKADAAPAAAAAAPAAAAPAAAAGAAVGAELVKKVDADLTKAGFEPFTNAPASS